MDKFEKLDRDYEREHGPQLCDKYDRQGLPLSLGEWARRIEDLEYRRVAETSIGDIRISTVWLGLDHSWMRGPALIFETMIFGGPEEIDQSQWRYSTEEQAIEGHDNAVQLVRDSILPPEAVESIRKLLTPES